MSVEAWKYVESIPIDRIFVLNPRSRGRRAFQKIVDSIARVGLKRPITVSRPPMPDDRFDYQLVCGQGRIEAFRELGQTHIPAIVISADEESCLVMSLVENLARRQHNAVDLLQDVGNLRARGYTDTQIADKIGSSPEYVSMIASLLENGEMRLLAAVESGTLPLSLAIEISRLDDDGAQAALTQAYTERKLRGKKLITVKRLLEQRQRRGKALPERFASAGPRKRVVTSDSLVATYRQEADRQRVLLKKAELTQDRLLFVVEAVRVLRSDEAFLGILREEHLEDMPAYISEQLASGGDVVHAK